MSLQTKLCVVVCLLGMSSCCAVLQAQTNKPRYLKRLLSFCPVDITQTNSKDGLFAGNTSTIKIDTTVIFKEVTALVPVENSAELKSDHIKIRDIRKDTVLLASILMEPGLAFNILQRIGSYSVIKFWPTKDKNLPGLYSYLNDNSKKVAAPKSAVIPLDSQLGKLKFIVQDPTNGSSTTYDLSKNYYVVPTQAVLDASTEFENKTGDWNLGFLVLPVKLRPFATEKGQFDFSDGYSVGTTFAVTIQQNINTGLTQSLLLYAGISSYTADSLKLKEKRNDYKIAAFSPAIGYMFEKNNVQLSLIIGFDFPAGNLQRKWVYRNQPWFGIGVGFSLFKINVDDGVEEGTN